MDYQYGSFQLQSAAMRDVLENLEKNKDKKFFIIVGASGTGKTTMMGYINRLVFSGAETNLFDETQLPEAQLKSGIVVTSKDSVSDVIRKLNSTDICLIEMPSLSERKTDIAPFATFFLEVLSLMNNQKTFKLTEKAVEKLLQYNWPENFHELEMVLEQAFMRSLHDETRGGSRYQIEPEHIGLQIETKQIEFSVGQKLDEVERKYILQTLYFVHQNRTKAAEILGISIRTLRNKINQYREEGYL